MKLNLLGLIFLTSMSVIASPYTCKTKAGETTKIFYSKGEMKMETDGIIGPTINCTSWSNSDVQAVLNLGIEPGSGFDLAITCLTEYGPLVLGLKGKSEESESFSLVKAYNLIDYLTCSK